MSPDLREAFATLRNVVRLAGIHVQGSMQIEGTAALDAIEQHVGELERERDRQAMLTRSAIAAAEALRAVLAEREPYEPHP